MSLTRVSYMPDSDMTSPSLSSTKQQEASASLCSQERALAMIPESFQPVAVSEEDYGGDYVPWALRHFTDPALVSQPFISMTIEVDLTEALACFQNIGHVDLGEGSKSSKGSRGNAGFTAWLMYHLMHSVHQVEAFRLRRVAGHWFRIDNMPLMTPVAVGGKQRFEELAIGNVVHSDWKEFAENYRTGLARLLDDSMSEQPPASKMVYELGQAIGNLPNMRFTHLTPHTSAGLTNNMFYFGQRRRGADGRLTMPLAMHLHHATTDPHVAQILLDEFTERLNSRP